MEQGATMRLDELKHQGREPSWRDEWAAHLDMIAAAHCQYEISREPLPYWKSDAIATYVEITTDQV